MTLQSLLGTTAAALTLLTVACNGGSGPLVTTGTSNGRDDPGSTYDTPPSTSDQTGGQCLSCDVVYDCPNAGDVGNGLTLPSSNGECTAALIDVVCSGALFGTGPCNSNGDGSFTCGNVTCTPEEAQQGGSGSSSGATPGGGGVSSSGGTSSGGFVLDGG